MQNHVHFIAIPDREDSLAKTFNAAHMRYSQYFNKKIKAKGHLWQGRFYSCVLDEPHLVLAAKTLDNIRKHIQTGRPLAGQRKNRNNGRCPYFRTQFI